MKKIIFLSALALVLAGCSLTAGPKANDGGIWKSADAGKTWIQAVAVPATGGKTASIANTDIRRIAFDPQDHNAIYLSTEKNGIVYSYDAGATWRGFKELNQGKVRAVAVDPKNKCVLYALLDNKLFKSSDCGRFWKNAYYHQNAETVLTDIKVDWYNSSVLYLSTSAGEILKSANAGDTWLSVKDVKGAVFADLVIDSRDSRIVYAASTAKGVYKTTDAGKTWTSLGEGLKLYAGSHEYKNLIADEAAPNGLILISRFGMLRSGDGGATWEIVNLIPGPKDTAITAVAVNPQNSREIYYTTKTTLVKSSDGGKTWSSQKLPFTRTANRIAIDPSANNNVYLGAFYVKE